LNSDILVAKRRVDGTNITEQGLILLNSERDALKSLIRIHPPRAGHAGNENTHLVAGSELTVLFVILAHIDERYSFELANRHSSHCTNLDRGKVDVRKRERERKRKKGSLNNVGKATCENLPPSICFLPYRCRW
jgi:hypothetical protein